MKKISYHVLRIGLAITFLWIGFLILQSPEAWGGYIQSWALKLIPGSIASTMTVTAILDILVGVCLLFNIFTWVAALLGVFHLVVVLSTTFITEITARDIGLLCATLAIAIESLPQKISMKIFKTKS